MSGIPHRMPRRGETPPEWVNLLLMICLFCSIILIAGCTAYTTGQDTTEPLYHHNWWNFYERGNAYLSQGEFAKALADFETCLGIRPGAKFGFDEEEWRVRTYGMHFLEGYFPNRELGVCLYHLQRFDGAVDFLEKSLGKEPSGRAKHFLNLARAGLMAGNVFPAPQIELEPASLARWTRVRQREISGKAMGQGLVRDVHINGQPQFIELAEAEAPFREMISLKPGDNTVTVSAQDLTGQETLRKVTWTADWQPPALSLQRIEQAGGWWKLEGVCSDDHALSGITIDGVPYFDGGQGKPSQTVPVQIQVPAQRTVVFAAVDQAGNTFESVLDSASFTDVAQGAWAPVLLAFNALSDTVTDVPIPLIASTPGQNAAPVDKECPLLAFGDGAAVLRVFDPDFFLDGTASDGSGLQSLTVADVQVLPPESRGAVRAYFARRLELQLGTNLLNVVASDVAGNTAARQLTVIYNTPEYLNEQFRLSVAVPPMPGEAAARREQMVRRVFESELLRDPARFHVLERDRGWEQILQELRLGVSDLADPRAALRIGKLLPADMFLMTLLMASGKGLTLYTRVVDAETGKTILDTDVYSDLPDQDLIRQIGGLVMKIEQRFPRVTGDVLDVNGKKATLAVGQNDGLTAGTSFIVVNRSAKNPGLGAGRVCKAEGRFVQLKMGKIDKTTCTVEIVPASAGKAVKEGDYVCAR